MHTAYYIKYKGQKASIIELYRKQWHQMVALLNHDIGPFKAGQVVQLNLLTKDMELVKETI